MSLYIIFSMNKSEYSNPTTRRFTNSKLGFITFTNVFPRVYFNDAELHFPFPRWLEDNGLLIRGWSVIIQ